MSADVRRYVRVVHELSYAHGLNDCGRPWQWANVLDAATYKRHAARMRRKFPGISIWVVAKR